MESLSNVWVNMQDNTCSMWTVPTESVFNYQYCTWVSLLKLPNIFQQILFWYSSGPLDNNIMILILILLFCSYILGQYFCCFYHLMCVFSFFFWAEHGFRRSLKHGPDGLFSSSPKQPLLCPYSVFRICVYSLLVWNAHTQTNTAEYSINKTAGRSVNFSLH